MEINPVSIIQFRMDVCDERENKRWDCGIPLFPSTYFLLFIISCAKDMAENTFATSAGRILRL
jgi:hypothetical protein